MRGDVSKLPKWAQREIGRLERDLAAAHAKLAAGPEDSNTFAEPYAAAPRPLGTSPHIRFVLGDGPDDWGAVIDAFIEGDHVVIRGGNGITVRPWAGNVLHVKPERW